MKAVSFQVSIEERQHLSLSMPSALLKPWLDGTMCLSPCGGDGTGVQGLDQNSGAPSTPAHQRVAPPYKSTCVFFPCIKHPAVTTDGGNFPVTVVPPCPRIRSPEDESSTANCGLRPLTFFLTLSRKRPWIHMPWFWCAIIVILLCCCYSLTAITCFIFGWC